MIIVLTSFTMKTHRHLIFNNTNNLNDYNYSYNNYNYVPHQQQQQYSHMTIRQLEKAQQQQTCERHSV